MLRYLNIRPGAVSVMGLMNDTDRQVTLLMDSDLKDWDEFACHPCVCTASLVLQTRDLLTTFLNATGHSPRYVVL